MIFSLKRLSPASDVEGEGGRERGSSRRFSICATVLGHIARLAPPFAVRAAQDSQATIVPYPFDEYDLDVSSRVASIGSTVRVGADARGGTRSSRPLPVPPRGIVRMYGGGHAVVLRVPPRGREGRFYADGLTGLPDSQSVVREGCQDIGAPSIPYAAFSIVRLVDRRYEGWNQAQVLRAFTEFSTLRDEVHARYALPYLPLNVDWPILHEELRIMSYRGQPVEVVVLGRLVSVGPEPCDGDGLTMVRVRLEFLRPADRWAHHRLLLRAVGANEGAGVPQILEAVSYAAFSMLDENCEDLTSPTSVYGEGPRLSRYVFRPKSLVVLTLQVLRSTTPAGPEAGVLLGVRMGLVSSFQGYGEF